MRARQKFAPPGRAGMRKTGNLVPRTVRQHRDNPIGGYHKGAGKPVLPIEVDLRRRATRKVEVVQFSNGSPQVLRILFETVRRVKAPPILCPTHVSQVELRFVEY